MKGRLFAAANSRRERSCEAQREPQSVCAYLEEKQKKERSSRELFGHLLLLRRRRRRRERKTVAESIEFFSSNFFSFRHSSRHQNLSRFIGASVHARALCHRWRRRASHPSSTVSLLWGGVGVTRRERKIDPSSLAFAPFFLHRPLNLDLHQKT